MMTIRVPLTALAIVVATGFAPGAAAQSWPTKPVKLIAVFPAGGSVDQVALATRIHEELAKAVKTPAVAEKLSAQGIDVSAAPPAELDAFVRKEVARWAKVVKDNNIKSGD